jgi:Tol biopolymer transport system component
VCVASEGTSSLAAKPKREDAGGVTKSTFCVALAALVLLVPFGGYGEETGKGRVPGPHGATGTIVFTLGEWDCPARGMLRPCYGHSNIWLVNSDGSGSRPLTRISAFQCGSDEPVWSPSGTRIAFTSTCAHQDVPPKTPYNEAAAINGNSNIWVMNDDGSNATPLTEIDGNRGPVWSPDGKKIAFSSGRALDGNDAAGWNANVWVVNSDGSGAVPLTRLGRSIRFVGSYGIAWSPGGSKLAFISDRALDGSNAQNTNEITNIWVVNADGSGLVPLTKLTAAHTYISEPVVWSPDSHKLALSWNRALDSTDAVEPGSPSNIWVANADGSGLKPLTRITDRFISASEPDWSPDGSKLIFVSNNNIWVMNADGSGAKPLTNLPAKFLPVVSSPVWSPDGTKIAFQYTDIVESTDSGLRKTANIWVINADGSGAVPVTHWQSGGVGGRLAWRPGQ